jgi:ATP:ADP antiporter, AAA family
MSTAVSQFFRRYFGSQSLLKTLLLGTIYLLLVAGYSLTRDLKNSVFLAIVGKEFVPWARILAMLFLVPAILFYSRLVDSVKRYNLLVYYSLFFGIMGIVCAYLLQHETIGIPNTAKSPFRFFGWFFYFFVESYSPFLVSVFWSFANSISAPNEARSSYGPIVVASKIGGIISTGPAWYLFSISNTAGGYGINDTTSHVVLMVVSSLFILLVPFAVYTLVKNVPQSQLHGYEAVYQVEKEKKEQGKSATGMFAGLKMFIQYPYVFGIFSVVFFYELINSVLGFLRLGVAEEGASSLSDVGGALFKVAFMTHLLGLFFSLIGTSTFLNLFGIRICLMLVPLFTGGFLVYLFHATSSQAIINAFIAFKAIHYAFNLPLRETLYIPTVKEIKFKSKSWIDSFGSKIARTSGSFINVFAAYFGSSLLLPMHSIIFSVVIVAWFFSSYWLGRRFDKAVKNNVVIGA